MKIAISDMRFIVLEQKERETKHLCGKRSITRFGAIARRAVAHTEYVLLAIDAK